MLSRRSFRTTLLAIVTVAATAAAVTIPGWRHRHTGGTAHTHSHGGVTHSHGDGSHHEHGRDGWHVHLTFFGFEFTLWEPGAAEVETFVAADDRRDRHDAEPGEGPVVTAPQPMATGWVSLFLVDPAPLPVRVRFADRGGANWLVRLADDRSDSTADPPPVPPPEPASPRGVRPAA